MYDLSRTGVYCIRHIASGKRYVGSAARSFSRRWIEHRYDLRRGIHHNPKLQRAWNKYGQAAFVFEVCEYTPPEYAVGVEQVMMDYYKSAERMYGYNACPTAGSCFGKRLTAEQRKRISDRLIGKPRPPGIIEKMAAANRGRKLSAGHRAKLSAISKARGLAPIEKMNAAWRGRKKTAEEIEKTASALRGRPKSAEHRAKLAAANVGKKASAETRAKLSAMRKGRPMNPRCTMLGRRLTDEHRAKIAAAHHRRRLPSRFQLLLFSDSE